MFNLHDIKLRKSADTHISDAANIYSTINKLLKLLPISFYVHGLFNQVMDSALERATKSAQPAWISTPKMPSKPSDDTSELLFHFKSNMLKLSKTMKMWLQSCFLTLRASLGV